MKHSTLLKLGSILGFLIAWEIIARSGIFSSFLFPPISESLIYIGEHPNMLFDSTVHTLKLLFIALGISLTIGTLIGITSSFSKPLQSVIQGWTSIFAPIPSIALLPFAMLWFGLGEPPIIFVTIFGSIWMYIINIQNGILTVKPMFVSIGKNYGLSRIKLARYIILPAALPSIITGVRTAWSGAWRTLIAAELVFGASAAGASGLGWLIYTQRYNLNSPGMLSGIIMISFIGIIAEDFVFKYMEKKTVIKWGMKK